MRLDYFDHALVGVRFDPADGSVRFEPLERPTRVGEITGLCTVLNGVVFVIAQIGGALWLFVGKRSAPFKEVRVSLGGSVNQRTLRLWWPDGSEDVFDYEPSGWIDNDPTPFVQRSDFDFGLYLNDLAENPDRQEKLCAIWR